MRERIKLGLCLDLERPFLKKRIVVEALPNPLWKQTNWNPFLKKMNDFFLKEKETKKNTWAWLANSVNLVASSCNTFFVGSVNLKIVGDAINRKKERKNWKLLKVQEIIWIDEPIFNCCTRDCKLSLWNANVNWISSKMESKQTKSILLFEYLWFKINFKSFKSTNFIWTFC